ncbi:uncharacterized protein EV420DRAFT_1271410 [Desarmillaria tabescens]|uniref:Heterokaryon incompatibility domain-containing protein n=1 Tax=Armillaria tabescens TaxID=1929756 RepID=A0AA39KAU2_ARMTA|nr:uncharacterized protein EV420DRAFT_1271410 [Desarmillaria tabescens]KAK0457587.1 hypothetical protein EV420DRAFT_1271410 [Desarmillaria tabescens]
MLRNKKIIDGDTPPRRVWDLHANQVVPWWVARKLPWAISHAWLDDKDLKREMTLINGYEWPVPMPKAANLNLIRIEMLNLGAEYAWLDVLCLRQEGQGEDPHGDPSQEDWEWREEWKVDVPTIGWIYHKTNQVVCYFSGLGLPLSFKPSDFESDRCWFNRAWTLQEISHNLLIAGETCHDGSRNDSRFMTKGMRNLFNKKLASLLQMSRLGFDSMFDVLSEMQKRKSTNPVDKVAGLVYLLYSQYIPKYDADQSEEDAWTELVIAGQDWFRADLFFLYPGPGNANKSWHPSWTQVRTDIFPKPSLSKNLYTVKVYQTDKHGDGYYGLRIDSCRVRGLADASSLDIPRRGKLDVNVNFTIKHIFDIVANHGFPIPDDMYTLIGTAKHSSTMQGVIWVVGKMEGPGEKFRKVSVFRMANGREAEKLWNIEAHSNTETFLL